MLEGTYMVRVLVNGHLIPYYQYKNLDDIEIRVADWTTPKLNSIQPMSAPPGSMITLNGEFRTLCYTRDVDPCADDTGARISRIYFGGQICNLLDPLTNDVYQNLTENTLLCKLEGHEVNYFNATVLVSEEFGRSLADRSIVMASSTDTLYNFVTYAEIMDINYQSGSLNGGLRLTITGNHFYSDENLKAKIEIANKPCNVINFQQNNYYDSVLECETESAPSDIGSRNYFVGGKGIKMTVENVTTAYGNLATANPSGSAVEYTVTTMNILINQSSPATVWFKGYFSPLKTGRYSFPVETTGYSQVFVSTTENPADKQLASSNQSVIQNNRVFEAGKK